MKYMFLVYYYCRVDYLNPVILWLAFPYLRPCQLHVKRRVGFSPHSRILNDQVIRTGVLRLLSFYTKVEQ